MTDVEIIKGLECCSKFSPGICKECPYYDIPCNMCSRMLRQHAFNLINHQKAEIKELTDKHWNECRQIAEDDKLLKDIKTAPVAFVPKTDSKEAVKKFAEALKAELKNLSKVHLFGTTFALVGENFIDGFVAKYEKGENI